MLFFHSFSHFTSHQKTNFKQNPIKPDKNPVKSDKIIKFITVFV